MKVHPSRPPARAAGYLLLESVAYIALLAVLLGVATSVFFLAWDDNKALRRNAEDVARALHAGEQWRADLRAAAGPVQLTDDGSGQRLAIPQASGVVLYTAMNGELRRQAGGDQPGQLWLARVKSSRMQAERRGDVPAWRWELELKGVGKTPRVRPLFTFETVAGTTNAP